MVNALLAVSDAEAVDEDGCTALHYAAANPGSDPTEATARAAALLAAAPLAARVADAAGRLPLHYAAARKAPPELAALLLEAWPEASKASDAEGQTAVQLAAAHRGGPALLSALSAARRSGISGEMGDEGSASSCPGAPTARPASHYNAALGAANVWELAIPPEVVDEARAIFEASRLREGFLELRQSTEPHRGLRGADGRRFFAVRAGGSASSGGGAMGGAEGGGAEGGGAEATMREGTTVGGFRSDIQWISVDDEATHAEFDRLFRRLGVTTVNTTILRGLRNDHLYGSILGFIRYSEYIRRHMG